MQGTRVGVLSKFMEWVKSDPKSIFWLAGMAGTGNTSIALTLCPQTGGRPGCRPRRRVLLLPHY